MAKKTGKPTNKQRDEAIHTLFQRTDYSYEVTKHLDIVIGLFIKFATEKLKWKENEFNDFIEKTQAELKEKNDTKTDGDADKPNLQGDTDGESSGTEGVREKE